VAALAIHPPPSNNRRPSLTQSLGFTARHFRLVSHDLSNAQKGQRVTLSQQLLAMLEVQYD
jgi:hypothetical protein